MLIKKCIKLVIQDKAFNQVQKRLSTKHEIAFEIQVEFAQFPQIAQFGQQFAEQESRPTRTEPPFHIFPHYCDVLRLDFVYTMGSAQTVPFRRK